jgi:hypothetical protein
VSQSCFHPASHRRRGYATCPRLAFLELCSYCTCICCQHYFNQAAGLMEKLVDDLFVSFQLRVSYSTPWRGCCNSHATSLAVRLRTSLSLSLSLSLPLSLSFSPSLFLPPFPPLSIFLFLLFFSASSVSLTRTKIFYTFIRHRSPFAKDLKNQTSLQNGQPSNYRPAKAVSRAG